MNTNGRTFVVCMTLLSMILAPVWAAEKTRFQESIISLNTERVGDQTCDTCISVVNDAEEYLADPKTQDNIVTFIQSNICILLPKDSSSTCQTEARVFVAQAVASMEQSISPDKACAYLGMCKQSIKDLFQDAQLNLLLAAQTLDIKAKNGPVQCTLCKFVMPTLIKRYQDPQSHEQIHTAALQTCTRFEDVSAKAQCEAEIEQLFASLDSLIEDVDPSKVCEVMQFCGTPKKTPEMFDHLRNALSALQSIPKEDPSPKNCESCKNVVEQISAVILDPDTQQEVFEYVKKGCEAVQSFKKECNEYVDQYGPIAMEALASYLQPDELCTRLGYCPTATLY